MNSRKHFPPKRLYLHPQWYTQERQLDQDKYSGHLEEVWTDSLQQNL